MLSHHLACILCVMTDRDTIERQTIQKVVALGAGFSGYRQPGEGTEMHAPNMTIATLNEPVSITYNASDPTDPKPAEVVAIQYWVKNDGTVQVSLLTKRVGQTIAPMAVLGMTWQVAK